MEVGVPLLRPVFGPGNLFFSTFFLKMPKAKASHYNGPDILKGGVHSSLRNMSNVKKTSDGEESFN